MSRTDNPLETSALALSGAAARALVRLALVLAVGIVATWFLGSGSASAADLPLPGADPSASAGAPDRPQDGHEAAQQLVTAVSQELAPPTIASVGHVPEPVVDEIVAPVLSPVTSQVPTLPTVAAPLTPVVEPVLETLTPALDPATPALDPLTPVIDPLIGVAAPIAGPVLGAMPALGPIGPVRAAAPFGSATTASPGSARQDVLHLAPTPVQDALDRADTAGSAAVPTLDSTTLHRPTADGAPLTIPAPLTPNPASSGTSSGVGSVGVGGAHDFSGVVPAVPTLRSGTWDIVALYERIASSAAQPRPLVAPD